MAKRRCEEYQAVAGLLRWVRTQEVAAFHLEAPDHSRHHPAHSLYLAAVVRTQLPGHSLYLAAVVRTQLRGWCVACGK
jgi:hypothetical protein